MLPKEIILQSIRGEQGRAAGATVVGAWGLWGARGPRLYDLEAKEKLSLVFEGRRKKRMFIFYFCSQAPKSINFKVQATKSTSI